MSTIHQAATPLLEAKNIVIGYHGKALGPSFNLSVQHGEILSLLGPNGSGKTTLFRTLLGVLAPIAGQVDVAGRALSSWSRSELAKQIGYVPQAHNGLAGFTVEEVVLMGRTARLPRFASPSLVDRQMALQMLERMGAGGLAQRYFNEISGGQRQLALIARALTQEVSLLVMDEPTASLDFGNQLKTLDAIASLRDQGVSILISTHQPEHALQVSDRIALLNRGELVAVGPAKTTATASSLANLYDVDPLRVAACLGNKA